MSRVPLQRLAIVPTSNAPPTWEWSRPSWYVLFLDALQASTGLSDADALLLVQAMEARKITLPCAECRAHYARDWEAWPFTLAHARSPDMAAQWVQALKDRVDARVEAEKKTQTAATAVEVGAGGGGRSRRQHPSAAATAVAHVAPATIAQTPTPKSRYGMRAPFASTVRAVASARLSAPQNVSGTPALRALAMRTALQDSAANRSGVVRGCRSCARK